MTGGKSRAALEASPADCIFESLADTGAVLAAVTGQNRTHL
jgi:hypothetical protein